MLRCLGSTNNPEYANNIYQRAAIHIINRNVFCTGMRMRQLFTNLCLTLYSPMKYQNCIVVIEQTQESKFKTLMTMLAVF